MNKKIIFITGGARSGKSRFAQELAHRFPGPKAYLATAQALDQEMAERILRHKEARPRDWHTLEEPMQVAEAIRENGDRFSLILLDCLTLWISNLMMAGWSEKKIMGEADRVLKACQGGGCSFILVGNEVGMGIVPENSQARTFRDLNGIVQQKIALQANEVYWMVSGLPQRIK